MTKHHFLLDTNIFSEPVRLNPNSSVMKRIEQHVMETCLASVVIHEALYGCYRLPESQKKHRIESYIEQVLQSDVLILPYNMQAAQWHATERVRLEKIGKTPAYVDGQIAAIAAINNLILVTNNERDFIDFQGLQIANWFA